MLNKTYTIDNEQSKKNDININNKNIRNSNRKSVNNDLNVIQGNVFPNSKVNMMPTKPMISLDKISKTKITNNSFLSNSDKKNIFDNTNNELKKIYSFSHEIENNEFEKEKYIQEYFSNITYFSESFSKI